jgi:ABC-type nitrate/sulfonate/bicarbonate transport system permease component
MKGALRAGGAIAVVLLLWEVLARAIDMPLLAPPPETVAQSALALAKSGELLRDTLASLQRLVVALVVGVPLGAMIGCALGYWPVLDAMASPFVRMFNAIPAIALVPFSLLWFGVTEFSRFTLLLYTISLTVTISARQGVRSVPGLRLRAGATLGVVGVPAFLRIILPSCIPAIIVGIRTAIGLGVMVVVAAEMLGADSGLGYLIMQARSQFNVPEMAVGVISLGLLSLLLDRLFNGAIESFVPRWSVRRRIR